MNQDKFEALPDVSEQLQFIDGFDGFKYHSINNHRSADWLNGAYYAFCEQEKRIEKALGFTEDVHSECWQDSINCIREVLK